MSNAHLAALALAATTLVASGCGGSSSGTASTASVHAPTQLVAQADPICHRANNEFNSAHLSTQNGIAQSATQLAAQEHQAATELASLKPPASMSNSWKTIVGAYQAVAKDMAELGEHAKAKGTLETEAPIIANLTNAQSDRAAVASQAGFKQCARF